MEKVACLGFKIPNGRLFARRGNPENSKINDTDDEPSLNSAKKARHALANDFVLCIQIGV